MSNGMKQHLPGTKARLTEQRTKELYDRFTNGLIKEKDLLIGVSFLVASKK